MIGSTGVSVLARVRPLERLVSSVQQSKARRMCSSCRDLPALLKAYQHLSSEFSKHVPAKLRYALQYTRLLKMQCDEPLSSDDESCCEGVSMMEGGHDDEAAGQSNEVIVID